MYSEYDIRSKAWLVVEVCNLVLLPDKLQVDKIFLVGSYASGKANEWSDIDFVVQLKGEIDPRFPLTKPRLYPIPSRIEEIYTKIDNKRVHVIFGTEQATRSLHQKHKHEKKNYSYRELNLGGIHATAHSTIT